MKNFLCVYWRKLKRFNLSNCFSVFSDGVNAIYGKILYIIRLLPKILIIF